MIQKEQKQFYQLLYSSNIQYESEEYKEALQSFIEKANICPLDEEAKALCEETITEKEILTSIKQLRNGKTPGTDGLSTDFYKFFWTDIKDLLYNSIQYAYKHGSLSIEQKRGIITLLPKKEKNRLFLKNWRPISLLNTDYKILAKILANKLKKVLPLIIDEDQTGYIMGRYIGQNIRIIEDVIYYTEKNNLPGIILSIDFEKAFDTVDWKYIKLALNKFNFGQNFIKWIDVIYNDIESCVMNNGHSSNYFSLYRGVRQGCPLSPYLFLIAVETLAINIRQDVNIQGIKVGNTEIKISQLADDTSCFLANLRSLENIIKTLSKFSKCSGLKINLEKTTAKYIGAYKNNDYYPHGLSWIKDDIFTLGVLCTMSAEENYTKNFKPRIEKLEYTLQMWRQRNLSIKGKITVVNCLALAPLIYLSSVKDTPLKVFQEVKKIILKFIWNDGTPKIAYDILCQDIKHGGLKLCNYEVKVKALLLSWVTRLTNQSEARWKKVPELLFKQDLRKMFETKGAKLAHNADIPAFYLNIYNNWSEIHTIEPGNMYEIQNETLWNNKFITIKGKSIHWTEWSKNNVNKIRDLVNSKGEFLSHLEIQKQFKIKCNFLQI